MALKSKIKRNTIAYVLMLMTFITLIWGVLRQGEQYNQGSTTPPVMASEVMTKSLEEVSPEGLSAFDYFWQSLLASLSHPFPLLLLQIIAILIAARIFSFIFKFLGQPGVIGEIVAGIALGPSMLGYFYPDAFAFLFAPGSLVPLNVISQIGLVLFMFIIGMELDLRVIRKKSSETLLISHASIVLPFLLVIIAAYFFYPEFGAAHTDFISFALFLGIAVSITAFPVLARIIQERNLSKTPMGKLAIACAANDDLTAWCMLAAIIAVVKAGSVASAGFTLLAAVFYILFMFGLVRPFMRRLGNIYNSREVMNKALVAFIFLVLILSAYLTEIIGIHALFGAFVAGVIMPGNISFRRVMTEKVEDVALVLFLPLFFVYTGLRTELGLLNSPHLWGVCAIFVGISITGKLVGAATAARFVGESWRDSLSIGALMNTRGLMELIVLNIGYEMGVLPTEIYTMFVIMALFTTFMTTPCLALIDRVFRKSQAKKTTARKSPLFSPGVLISFSHPQSAPVLLQLARQLCGRYAQGARFTAAYFTIGTETSPINAGSYSHSSFLPIQEEAKELGVEVETYYRVTDLYLREMGELVRSRPFDLVLVGAGNHFVEEFVEPESAHRLFSGKLSRINRLIRHNSWYFPGESLRDKARRLFDAIPNTYGVFINRKYNGAQNIGVILNGLGDSSLLIYSTSVAGEAEVVVRVNDPALLARLEREISSMPSPERDHCRIDLPHQPFKAFLEKKDLIIISYSSWLAMTREEPQLVSLLPSFLVIKPADLPQPSRNSIKQKALKAQAEKTEKEA